MGQWNEERDIILAGLTAKDTDLKYVLTKTPMAEDTFFDIPRMRPYYSIKHLSYGTRIYVDYVTSFANCKSPIHAARVYCSILRHIKNKLGNASSYVGVQDNLSDDIGHVTASHVTFKVVVAIRGPGVYQAPPSYAPEHARCAATFRRLYGVHDPYISGNSVTTPQNTATVTTPATTTNTATTNTTSVQTVDAKDAVTPAADTSAETKVLDTEVPEESGNRVDYLKSLRDNMRKSLEAGKKPEDDFKSETQSTSKSTGTTVERWQNLLGKERGADEVARTKDLGQTNLVAVYGSLRQGYHNHHLLTGAKVEGKGRIKGVIFPLGPTVPGAYFPQAGDNLGGQFDRALINQGVEVELYTVPYSMMYDLDTLEGYTGNEASSSYVRVARPVSKANGDVVFAFVYEYNGRMGHHKPIESGDWADYASKGRSSFRYPQR
jgi:gamma-glutamylcyclotransferase (GGCT)/AIG2-like uncharacterized protein YtfP